MTHTAGDGDGDGDRERRRAWVRRMLTGLDAWPRFGTTAWLGLPDGDRRKVAAVVVAAECWARDADELPERTHRQLAAARDAEDAHWAQLHAATAPRAVALALNRYRPQSEADRVTEARRPRPGDRPGRGPGAIPPTLPTLPGPADHPSRGDAA